MISGLRNSLCLLALASSVHAHDSHSRATYLGNEGVLVTRGHTKVLFDAFYSNSYEGYYLLVPEAMAAAMLAGEPPYDGIDAIWRPSTSDTSTSSTSTTVVNNYFPPGVAPSQVAAATVDFRRRGGR